MKIACLFQNNMGTLQTLYREKRIEEKERIGICRLGIRIYEQSPEGQLFF